MELRRFQSAVPNARGTFPGVFALVNGLAHDGLLSEAEELWRVAAHRRCAQLYRDPSTLDPACYDRTVNPGARAWFKATAGEVLALVPEYLAVLDRHRVPWVELRTGSPGRIVYEDAVQVVAVPFTHEADWPFGPGRAPSGVS